MEKINIFHTNDLHSHFENWPQIRRYLQGTQLEDDFALYLDSGDFMDRAHSLTEATHGKANIDIMNQVHYNAITIGNNEGITNSKAQLNRLYDSFNGTVVLSNLLDKETGTYPKWAKPYDIYETSKGYLIGVIGVTAPMPFTYEPFGWDVLDPYEAVEAQINYIKNKVNSIIVLSHLGIESDIQMAKLMPSIDVILGGHTHHLLPEGKVVNSVLLGACGKFGEAIGKVELELDSGKVVSKKAGIIPLHQLESFDSDLIESDHYLSMGKNLLENEKICTLPSKLRAQHELTQLSLKAIKQKSGCEVAMLNTGLFLDDLESGELTKKNLHDCLPHPMNLISVTLQGSDLIRLAKEIQKNKDFLRYYKIIGMKFRGRYFGELCYDGFEYHPETQQGFWNGKLVVDRETYTFVTVDYMLFLPFFPTIEIAGEVALLGPDFLRTIVGDYLRKLYTIRM